MSLMYEARLCEGRFFYIKGPCHGRAFYTCKQLRQYHNLDALKKFCGLKIV